MAKIKQAPTRKSAERPASRPPAPLVNSLPPQILEEAAQGWLKSSGGSSPAPSAAKTRDPKRDALVECLDSTLKSLRLEIAELRERVSRLETQ